MLFTTPYSTSYTTTLTLPLKNRILDIGEKAMREHLLDEANTEFSVLYEHRVLSLQGEINIPVFNHPFIYANNNNTPMIIVDNRANFNTINSRIKNPIEYNFNILRAYLEYFWVTSNQSFMAVSEFTIDVFATWTSSTLSRFYNLSVVQATQLKVVMAVYYNSFFMCNVESYDGVSYALKTLPSLLRVPKQVIADLIDLSEANEFSLNRFVSTPVNSDQTSQYAGKGDKVYAPTRLICLNEFIGCNIINVGDDSSSRKSINVLLNSLMNGGFSGANNTELVAICLEHPPMLLAMIKRCLEDNFQKKFKIGMAVDCVKRNYDIATFNKFFSYVESTLNN